MKNDYLQVHLEHNLSILLQCYTHVLQYYSYKLHNSLLISFQLNKVSLGAVPEYVTLSQNKFWWTDSSIVKIFQEFPLCLGMFMYVFTTV